MRSLAFSISLIFVWQEAAAVDILLNVKWFVLRGLCLYHPSLSNAGDVTSCCWVMAFNKQNKAAGGWILLKMIWRREWGWKYRKTNQTQNVSPSQDTSGLTWSVFRMMCPQQRTNFSDTVVLGEKYRQSLKPDCGPWLLLANAISKRPSVFLL